MLRRLSNGSSCSSYILAVSLHYFIVFLSCFLFFVVVCMVGPSSGWINGLGMLNHDTAAAIIMIVVALLFSALAGLDIFMLIRVCSYIQCKSAMKMHI